MISQLSPLQRQVVQLLAGLGWTLTGGGALVGYHLGHRQTRDLDLFWHGRTELDWLPAEVERRLRAGGLTVDRIQTAPAFRRLRVSDDSETIPIDLVADPVPVTEPPTELEPGVLVDTPQEILANKLTALLSRWAVRDLVDVQALLLAGCELDRGLAAAARKDGGFSPTVLAWVLANTPAGDLSDELTQFRDDLMARLVPTEDDRG